MMLVSWSPDTLNYSTPSPEKQMTGSGAGSSLTLPQIWPGTPGVAPRLLSTLPVLPQGCLSRASQISELRLEWSFSWGPAPTPAPTHPDSPPYCEVSTFWQVPSRGVRWGWGLDMAPCPQPDSCLVGSPLGLICLSLWLMPAAGASSCPQTPPPARPPPLSSRSGVPESLWWLPGRGVALGSLLLVTVAPRPSGLCLCSRNLL